MILLNKNLLMIMTMALIILSCSPKQKTDDKAANLKPAFDSLLHSFHEERLKLSPFDATMSGDNRYNDLFPNVISQGYLVEVRDFYQRYKNALKNFDRNTLSQNDQMSYDVLDWECDMA